MFYQDRLGTNIGKTQKKPVLLQVAAQLLGVDAVLAVRRKPVGAGERDAREAEEESKTTHAGVEGGGEFGALHLDSDSD